MTVPTDQTILCRDCRQPFVFAVGEQHDYQINGYGAPTRCPNCRRRKRYAEQGSPISEITCARCGAITVVPFVPEEGRRLLCQDCLSARR